MKLLKPIAKEQLIGKITYSLDKRIISEINVIADRSINKRFISIAIPKNIPAHLSWYIVIIAFFLFIILIRRHFKRNRRRIFKRRKY